MKSKAEKLFLAQLEISGLEDEIFEGLSNAGGHIHGGAGMWVDGPDGTPASCPKSKEGGPISFHNVSICDEAYNPVHNPHTLWLAERE